MINAWSLLYDEIYGDDEMTDKTYPVENTELNDENIVINTGTGNTIFNVPDSPLDDVTFPSGTADDTISITGGDFIDFTGGDDYLVGLSTASSYVDTLNLDLSGCYSGLGADDVITFGDTPTPGIESNNPRKYKEDESIKALQDYISTTYGGHYTLSLIHI